MKGGNGTSSKSRAARALACLLVLGACNAATLGTERRGSGALIRDGLVLTIGYLVVEAESVRVTAADGRGDAGVEVPLRVLQGAQVRHITVRTIDRMSYFRPALTY